MGNGVFHGFDRTIHTSTQEGWPLTLVLKLDTIRSFLYTLKVDGECQTGRQGPHEALG